MIETSKINCIIIIDGDNNCAFICWVLQILIKCHRINISKQCLKKKKMRTALNGIHISINRLRSANYANSSAIHYRYTITARLKFGSIVHLLKIYICHWQNSRGNISLTLMFSIHICRIAFSPQCSFDRTKFQRNNIIMLTVWMLVDSSETMERLNFSFCWWGRIYS